MGEQASSVLERALLRAEENARSFLERRLGRRAGEFSIIIRGELRPGGGLSLTVDIEASRSVDAGIREIVEDAVRRAVEGFEGELRSVAEKAEGGAGKSREGSGHTA